MDLALEIVDFGVDSVRSFSTGWLWWERVFVDLLQDVFLLLFR